MLLDFFYRLRSSGLPISTGEYLNLLQGMSEQIGVFDLNHFYSFARLCLIKDESLYDQFDQVFNDYWSGKEQSFEEILNTVPDEWLLLKDPSSLTEEQKAMIEAMGGWDKLMETLQKRLDDQTEEHHGGKKWIGTGGTSPFGHGGFNPEGVRVGGHSSQKKAVKVWEQRRFKDLDGNQELGTRNFKMALRKLRRLAREGRPDTLDIDNTISSTAKNAGLLDIKMQAERRNTVKVLLLMDVGGSMDYHSAICETLFSAARAEFKHLEFLYFHNFIYEKLWRNNSRRHTETISLNEMMRTYNANYKLILVGDATMSPYEIAVPGGSVEHWNEEAGSVWFQRLIAAFPNCVWLNPEKEDYWQHTQSIAMTQQLMHNRMHSLTVDGIQQAIDTLKTPISATSRPLH